MRGHIGSSEDRCSGKALIAAAPIAYACIGRNRLAAKKCLAKAQAQECSARVRSLAVAGVGSARQAAGLKRAGRRMTPRHA